MSDRPSIEPRPTKIYWWLMTGLVLLVLVLVFSPVAVGGGYGLYVVSRNRLAWRRIVIFLAIFSSLWFIKHTPIWFLHPIKDLSHSLLITVPVIPLGAAAVEPLRKVHKKLMPKSLGELVEEDSQELPEKERQESQKAHSKTRRPPESKAGHLRLGVVMNTAQQQQHLGVVKDGSWISLTEQLLDQHIFILGTTGSGKSETIKRLIYEIMLNTDRDLFLVDGKGDGKFAKEVKQMCKKQGRGDTPIFRMGQVEQGQPYNGFVGSKEDIYNRLCALVGVAEAEGNAQFYADINKDLLQLVCFAPCGPPRSLQEVRQRLSKNWLIDAWMDDPDEMETIDNEIKDDYLDGLRWRIRPRVRELAPMVNPDGFVLEDTHSAIFSIRTQSVSETARGFLMFLVEDLKDFAGKRQRRSGVLIIDEFGAFGNKNIVALLTLARSAKLGVILATQDIANLGDEITKKLILANTRTKILMATDYPEEVASLAGTKKQIESSMQHDEGQATGMGSARLQDTFVVPPNEVRRLQAGEAFVIRQQQAYKIKVAMVEKDEKLSH